jgi:hypothetical protein
MLNILKMSSNPPSLGEVIFPSSRFSAKKDFIKVLDRNMSEPECHDNENQLGEKKSDEEKPIRHRSESTIRKPNVVPHMSAVHEIAFIMTICMAQILALSGLGQALRMSPINPI